MPDLDLPAALTRVRAWLSHRQRLREAATPGPWIDCPRGVYRGPLDTALCLTAECLRDDANYLAAVASPDVSAHADAGIEAWCRVVELIADLEYVPHSARCERLMAAGWPCGGSEKCRVPCDFGDNAGRAAVVARFIAFASSPLLDVPEDK